MESMKALTLEHKKIWVLGLLFNCPIGTEKENCTINGMRELKYEEREKKVFDMPETDLDDIITSHKSCMKKRGF